MNKIIFLTFQCIAFCRVKKAKWCYFCDMAIILNCISNLLIVAIKVLNNGPSIFNFFKVISNKTLQQAILWRKKRQICNCVYLYLHLSAFFYRWVLHGIQCLLQGLLRVIFTVRVRGMNGYAPNTHTHNSTFTLNSLLITKIFGENFNDCKFIGIYFKK